MRSSFRYVVVFMVIVFAAGMKVMADSYPVTSKVELENALAAVVPGDSIILKDQAWTGMTIVLNCKGTEANPITICSETPGGASLENGSRIEIGGEYIIISGLRFVNGYNLNNAVNFKSGAGDAFHCRLTNCLIDGYNPPDPSTKYHWVVVYGEYNRIDHCRFSHMNHCGVTVMVKAGANQPGHHKIDHNFFGPKPEGDGNGYESIKMGGGDYSMYPLYTTVEKNYFYRCDGEVELISNKSWNNIYRYNTFYECSGTLTLRWGRQCIVEGNYFLGNGWKASGGIRITDQDHIIVNNYLENLTGTDARAAISMMSGIPDTEGGNSGHGQTKNARILYNTIINCRESLNIGYYDDDDLGDPRGELMPPENCLIANNIIWSSQAPLIKEDWAPSINTEWFTNMAFGADLGLEPDSGMIIRDPGLEQSPAGVWKLAPESPAVNSATLLADTVKHDFQQQERSDGLPDIGADELSDGPGEVLPIRAEEAGPDWYDETVNMKTFAIEQSISVYPNPAGDRFCLRLNETNLNTDIYVEILNLSGVIVYSERFFNVTLNPEIAVDKLSGLHIVRIRSEEGVYLIKVLFN